MILTNVEAVGILFTLPKGGRRAGYFRRNNDRLYLEIEEELVAAPEKVRRRSWQVNEEARVPSGRLIFSLADSRYSSGNLKYPTEVVNHVRFEEQVRTIRKLAADTPIK